MGYEIDVLSRGAGEGLDVAWADAAAGAAALPPGTVMAERAAGWLRGYLERRGLDDYRVFCSNDLDLHDIDEHLGELGGAAWEPVESLVAGGAQPAYIATRRKPRATPAGVLPLAAHEAVLGRWYWYDTDNAAWYALHLVAAPSVDHYAKLRDTLRELRRRPAAAAWQVVSGAGHRDGEKLPRDGPGLDSLVLHADVRARLDAEVAGFFNERAAALYAKLGVAYRRGVLLYGPPGNGKTSIIRALAAKLPAVSGFVLRATGDLDDDDFTTVVRRWAAAAPAILVVEDLNWLFPNRVNISTFLNLIDGLDAPSGAGLMLVASTNHPETLDPALSDRPGRFDVTLEVPSPDSGLRREYFRRALAGEGGGLPSEAVLGKLVRETAGLSFAHLREVTQAAGLAAIRAGREVRSEEDLLRAADEVARAHRAAGHGFPVRPEEPFGLAQWRSGRDDGEE